MPPTNATSLSLLGMTDHHELLVMAPRTSSPGIEEHVTPVVRDLPRELGVRLLALVQPARV